MDRWKIIETGFNPQLLHPQETVFTLGNGYLGTRGTFEEGYPGEQAITLINGLYDDVPLFFTELVNAPNWTNLQLYVNGNRFRLDQGTILDYRRELDLRTATLTRAVVWRSPAGETVEVHFERFASLHDPHLLAVRARARARDFTGVLEFRAGLPGHQDNAGWVHWDWQEQGTPDAQTAFLQLKTRVTAIPLSTACHLRISGVNRPEYAAWDSPWHPTLVGRCAVEQGEWVQTEKLVSIFTGRDPEPDPAAAALERIAQAASLGYDGLHEAHRKAWESEWQAADITIEGDDEADLSLRYSLFQLLIAAPRQDDRVSIPAKTLSGLGYRGHVFWDTEIFILPFFTYTRPEIARNLLMYRYHTLSGARKKALAMGFEGAMYAWESAATGEETTPRWLPVAGRIEMVRIWCGDIEHHISADVAYAVHQYWRVTGDDDFYRDYGAEIVLDTARFWGSRAEWNLNLGRYELNDVIGPDEYHEHVDNNAYTNNMARWNIQTALDTLQWLEASFPDQASALKTLLDLTPERLELWGDIVDRLYLGFDKKTGLFEQFEGYFNLLFTPQEQYEPRIQSLQSLLGIEGVQAYQFIKQPDVLMLLYLLDIPGSENIVQVNWDFYTPRTDLSYGSSLGPAIQAALAARMRVGNIQTAYQHFIHAARTDLQDVRGNSSDGIHAATAGGLWQSVVLGFAGLLLTPHGPAVYPNLPEHWKRLRFRVKVKGQAHEFDLGPAAPPARPGQPILGVIFDLDGVLTDTSELHYQAWQRLADEEGLPFNREQNEALRGIPRRESLLRILKDEKRSEEQLQEMMERKNRNYQELAAALNPADLLPGAGELLASLRASGIKIAIGSASKNARSVVERLGIGPAVDAIADGYSVSRQKPAPDLFLHAARQLQLPPAQCVVFEDAEAGVEAALAGGMWAVGLGPESRVGQAHLVLPDLQGVGWEQITGLLQASKQPQRNALDR